MGDPLRWETPLWLVPVVVGGALAVADRRWTLLRGWIVASAVTVGALVSIAAITGEPFGYLRIGLRTTSLGWIAIGVAAVASTPRLGALRRVLIEPVAAVAVVVATAVGAVGAVGADNPEAAAGEGVPTLADAIVSTLEEHGYAADGEPGGPLEISNSPDLGAALHATGLLVELERRGWEVRAREMGASLVGEHRVRDDAVVGFRVIAPDEVRLHLDNGWRLVGAWEPFDVDERRRLDEIDRRHDVGRAFAGLLDEDQLEALERAVDERQSITRGRVEAAVVWRPLPRR